MTSEDSGKSTQHVWLNLRCTSTSAYLTERLIFTDSQVTCVRDLQLLLESKHRIPVCDQLWRYNSQVLNGEETLKSLYFRPGDTFEVSYLATAAVEEINGAIETMKNFQSKPDPSAYDWQLAAIHIQRMAFDQFLPWKNAGTLANRHYFHQEGGLDLYFDIFRYVKKERIQVDLDEMLNLEIVCLELLWNFSETGPDRQLVMRYGGLEMVLESLVRAVRYESSSNNVADQGCQVADIAVGCLVQ
jgi:hypothetical protein